jgi:hypothetical protein
MRTAGNAGGSAPRRQDVVNGDGLLPAVEIAHRAGSNVSGADGQPRHAMVEQRKIDKLVQGLA